MQKYLKIPLWFLCIGSLLGVFLRWQFIEPTTGVNYIFFLHGHSHIMFLGWVFNVLYIGFVPAHILNTDRKFFIVLFFILQVLVAGMLISFPLQGYGLYSILFSTLHTLVAFVFIIRWWRKTREIKSISFWYIRVALIFFIASAAGPFSLGYLMSHGMASSHWYNFSIYFYLHFQYNGFFFFGILGLFFGLLENRKILFNESLAKTSGAIFALTCIPAYLLSTLWAKPGYVVNIAAALAALIQCVGLSIFLKMLRECASEIKTKVHSGALVLLSLVLPALTLKLLLQLVSAFPFAAQMAYEIRPIVIAYLHLVLVGVITAFLFAWYIEQDLISQSMVKPAIGLFLFSFIGMEVFLGLSPWSNVMARFLAFTAPVYTFVFSALLAVSYFTFLAGSYKKTDKISF